MKLPLYEPVVLDGVRADTRPTCAKSRIGGYMEVSRAKGGATLRPSGEGCAARRERVAVEVHAPRGDGARIYASSCLRTEWQYPPVIVNIRATRMCRRATLAGCPALRYAELFPSKTIATSARLGRCAPLAERCSLRAHITTQVRPEEKSNEARRKQRPNRFEAVRARNKPTVTPAIADCANLVTDAVARRCDRLISTSQQSGLDQRSRAPGPERKFAHRTLAGSNTRAWAVDAERRRHVTSTRRTG